MERMHFLLLMIAAALLACSKDPAYPELVRAARSIEQVVAPFSASRSSFFVVPDQVARLITESNLEQGMQFQSF